MWRTVSLRHRRPWWTLLAGAVASVALAAPAGAGAVQQDPVPTVTLPANPLEPAGRAVCNLAFSLTSVLGLTSFVVPPDGPLGPNEVIVALRPILATCVGLFPPAPARTCFTSDLYPSTGLPLTLPDPLGILTEQVEALSLLLDPVLQPLGVALTGPLREVFASALLCQDLADPHGGDGAPAPASPAADPTSPSASTVVPLGDPSLAAEPTVSHPEAAGAGDRAAAPTAGRSASVVSAVPETLRGPAAGAAALFAVVGALILRRLLSPRRRRSLLGAGGVGT